MKNVREIFNGVLIVWLLAIGIDGFSGGVTAGKVGATISLLGAAISFIFLIASHLDFRTPPREK